MSTVTKGGLPRMPVARPLPVAPPIVRASVVPPSVIIPPSQVRKPKGMSNQLILALVIPASLFMSIVLFVAAIFLTQIVAERYRVSNEKAAIKETFEDFAEFWGDDNSATVSVDNDGEGQPETELKSERERLYEAVGLRLGQ